MGVWVGKVIGIVPFSSSSNIISFFVARIVYRQTCRVIFVASKWTVSTAATGICFSFHFYWYRDGSS